MRRGSTVALIATVTSIGFAGDVILDVTGLPSGASVSFATTPLAVPFNGMAETGFTIATAQNTAAGDYPLTVSGRSGPIAAAALEILSVTQH